MMLLLVVLAGLALIVVLAVVVALVDARRSTAWRDVAAERREAWEANRPTEDYFIG